MSDLKWTKATRKKLHGFRARHKTDPGDAVPTSSEAWDMLMSFKPQVEGATTEVAAIVDQHATGQTPTKLTLEGEYARTAIVSSDRKSFYEWKWDDWRLCRALAALWAEVEGIAFAVNVVLQEPPFSVAPEYEGDAVHLLTPIDPEYDHTLTATQPLLWSLRARLATVSDSEFEAARDACLQHFDEPLPEDDAEAALTRASLVLMFSRDRKLAGREIDRMLAESPEGNDGRFDVLFAAAPDTERARALAQRVNVFGFAFDLVEGLGSDAVPALREVLDRANAPSQYNRKAIKNFDAAIALAER